MAAASGLHSCPPLLWITAKVALDKGVINSAEVRRVRSLRSANWNLKHHPNTATGASVDVAEIILGRLPMFDSPTGPVPWLGDHFVSRSGTLLSHISIDSDCFDCPTGDVEVFSIPSY